MYVERALEQLSDIHSAILTQLQLPRYQGVQLLTNALKRFHQLCKTLLYQRSHSETLGSGICLWLQKYLAYCFQYDFKFTLFFEFTEAVKGLKSTIEGHVDSLYVDILGISEDPTAIQSYIARFTGQPFSAISRKPDAIEQAQFPQASALQKQMKDLTEQLQQQQTQADTQYKELQNANFSLVEYLREMQQRAEEAEHYVSDLTTRLANQEKASEQRELFYKDKISEIMSLLGGLLQPANRQDQQFSSGYNSDTI